MPGGARVKVAGLWYRRRESGRDVMSGTVPAVEIERALAALKQHGNLVSIVIFENYSKTNATEPDLVMYLEPRLPIEGARTA